MIVLYLLVALCIRQLVILSRNNSGKLKCEIGAILGHRFVEYYNERVCSICGLYQKLEPAGLLMSDGETWYDKGYAENKETLVQFYLDEKRSQEEKYKKWDKERKTKTINTKISTPSRDTHEKRSE